MLGIVAPCCETILLFVFCVTPLDARDYHVGTDLEFNLIDQVPWEQLMPGDRVLIHHREQPYDSKWVLCRRGTAEQPIFVSGVPGPQGELPVIDGENAITRPELRYWGGERGVIKIGGSTVPPDVMPAYIVIENLDIRHARPPYYFFGVKGVTKYMKNAAAIYLEKGEHIIIRHCSLTDCGNGLFIAPESKNIVVEQCTIGNNGIEGSLYEHNIYTEALGITFQFNRLNPLRKGCLGNNLKDRSAGTVVRYNWIDGGNRLLDLVDAEGSDEIRNSPMYGTSLVYGNIMLKHDGGNNQIMHYGGDSGDESSYRHGTLNFYHNTVFSDRNGPTTLVRLSSSGEAIDCRNNIIVVTAGEGNLALLEGDGSVALWNNWISPGWKDSHGDVSREIRGRETTLGGVAPGFVDVNTFDFRLTDDSPCRGVAGPLLPLLLPAHDITYEYVKHCHVANRTAEGRNLGALSTSQ
ncbi:MAG: polysaccharide-degrading enzyme [Planctomycetota bacterium]|nr:polysaccharide-degrading enzyme [Planctomycetota bacterium]